MKAERHNRHIELSEIPTDYGDEITQTSVKRLGLN